MQEVDQETSLGTVEVDYTFYDVIALQAAAWRYWLRVALFPFALIVLISLIPAITEEETIRTSLASIEWSLAAILSLIIVGALMLATAVGYTIRRFRGKHRGIILGVAQQGAFFRGPDAEGTIFWGSLKRVSSTNERLMLFLSSNSALIVPKRCLSDPNTFDRWVEFSKARWTAAKSRSR